jgi:hypothetical protein
MNKKVIAVFAVTTALLSVAATRHRPSLPPATPAPLTLNAARSFAVTDFSILDSFSFAQVMNWIVAGSSTTGEQLMRQLFDTQNPSPGMADAAAPHCDDFVINGSPTFNGFPRHCPTPEGKHAATPLPFANVTPLALINRFDLAPADGANCGQYRIIYFTYLQQPASRFHMILEAVLPNPHREQGIAGCKAVAQFWADLSSVDSTVERRARLEKFFYDGLPGFEPVLRAAHFSAAAGGGVRTRQNDLPATTRWRGYQFRIEQQCGAGGSPCALRMLPDVLENLPFGPMFDANVDTPVARSFREHFLTQIPTLAINDLNQYRMKIDRQYLLGESDPLDDSHAFSFQLPFNNSQSTDAGKAFRAQIDAELKRIGSTLTPENIVARAETQTCAGCHFVPQSVGGGLIFPGAIDAEHVLSLGRVAGDDGPESRWGTSGALEKVFIPNRMNILRDFLLNGRPPEHSN